MEWYVVNVLSGHETKVCSEINRIAKDNDKIAEAFIPVKKVLKVSKGKNVEADQKIYPGYVFVNMVCDRATLDTVIAVPKVSGFLGQRYKPEAIPEEKVKKLKQEAEEGVSIEENAFEIGESVRVIDGPFESFIGVIEGKDEEKNILKISVSIFGRSTLVDIDTSRVEKI